MSELLQRTPPPTATRSHDGAQQRSGELKLPAHSRDHSAQPHSELNAAPADIAPAPADSAPAPADSAPAPADSAPAPADSAPAPADRAPAPADITLILRADAELRFLRDEVIPVLAQLEAQPKAQEHQLWPAAAYLQAAWPQACRLAREADQARVRVQAARGSDISVAASEAQEARTARTSGDSLPRAARAAGDPHLAKAAFAYHDTVRRLRQSLAARVALLTEAGASAASAPLHQAQAERIQLQRNLAGSD